MADRKGNGQSLSHHFEHLSCFLPGLLALGAHTLPLDNLESLGISLSDIDGDGLYGDAGRDFSALTGYDLKKLHLWAAEGLAQTCYLTYADQPTGLAPDEIIMKTEDRGSKNTWSDQWRTRKRTVLWMDAMRTWKSGGSRSAPPGLGDKAPVVYANKEVWGAPRKVDRDYIMRKFNYFLRPEVSPYRILDSS